MPEFAGNILWRMLRAGGAIARNISKAYFFPVGCIVSVSKFLGFLRRPRNRVANYETE